MGFNQIWEFDQAIWPTKHFEKGRDRGMYD